MLHGVRAYSFNRSDAIAAVSRANAALPTGGSPEGAEERPPARRPPTKLPPLSPKALALRNFVLPLLVQAFGEVGALDYCRSFLDWRRFTSVVLRPVCFLEP